jgi:hypothetical protein
MPSRKVLGLFASACAVLTFGAISTSAVRAEDFAGDVPDRVWIDVGWAVNDISTDAVLIGKNGVGAAVNFEDVFDLNSSRSTTRMLGSARVSAKRRWIDFGYVDITRSNSKVLSKNVDFGDYTFQAGGEVTTKFNTRFMYVAFRYDFLHEDKVRISGSAGMTAIKLSTGLSGQASANGGPVTAVDRSGSATAPVPMVGLNLDWALTRRLVVRTYTRFFKLNLSEFNGGLFENGVRLNWYFVKNFGLGVGVDKSTLRIDELKVGNGNVLKADYSVTGLGVYATLAF